MAIDPTESIPTRLPFTRILKNSADEWNAIGEYVSFEYFYIAPPEDEVWFIDKFKIVVVSSSEVVSEAYGNLPPLEVPLRFGIGLENGSFVAELTNENGITKNSDFNLPVFYSKFANGYEYQIATWEPGSGGQPIVLYGQLGHRLQVRLFGIFFSTLGGHYFVAEGYNDTVDSAGRKVPYSNRH